MSSSRGKRPTTAWRANPGRALGLAWAGLLALAAAALPAEEQETGCVRVSRQEALVEGPSLRVRGEVTNTCPFVVRNVRVQVEARDKDGRTLGTGDAFVEPAVLGAQEGARFDVPIPTIVEPAEVNITATWRRLGRF